MVETENTIDIATVRVGIWSDYGRQIERTFKAVPVGRDTNGRLFVQTGAFLNTSLDQWAHFDVSITDNMPVGMHIVTPRGARGAIERFAREFPEEDPSKFLVAPYAQVNSDLTVTIDTNMTGLWWPYEQRGFVGLYILGDVSGVDFEGDK